MSADPDAVLLAIAGPTAAGKSAVALEVAARFAALGRPVEIVCCDAMQVYRRLDVGTAKPSPEDRAAVAHHCLDLVDPDEQFSAADYQRHARAAIEAIHARGAVALLVGGTGLYLRAVADGLDLGTPPEPNRRNELEAQPLATLVEQLERLDPERASRTDLANPRRVVRAIELARDGVTPQRPHRSTVALRLAVVAPTDRSVLYDRIDRRVGAMLEAGWLDEVRALDADGIVLSRTASAAIGYAALRSALHGERTLDDAADEIRRRTRAYARRQLTWFRAEPRARWFDLDEPGAVDALLVELAGNHLVAAED